MNPAKSRNSAWALVVAIASLFLAIDALAVELTVCQANPGPNDFISIQEAVNAAHDGDLIRICAGVHTEVGILISGRQLRIEGSGDATIIQAAAQVSNASGRVLTIHESSVDVVGLTLRHGRCKLNGTRGCRFSFIPAGFSNGGGLFIVDSDVFLKNVRIHKNFAQQEGGGIFQRGGSLIIEDSELANNGSEFSGGAIFTQGTFHNASTAHTQLRVSNSIIENNLAGTGGGISAEGSELHILQGTRILNNSAESSGGGGIYFSTNLPFTSKSADLAFLLIENSTISENEATHGGGLFIAKRRSPRSPLAARISASVFESNDASTHGGAIAIEAKNWADLDAVQLRSNDATQDGGGIWISNSKLNIENSTLHDNEAQTSGGGIFSSNTELDIRTSTLSKNRSILFGGGGISVVGGMRISNSTVSANVAGQRGGGIQKNQGGAEFETVEMTNVTVAKNEPVGLFAKRWIRVKNSLVADNGTDCDGLIDDAGLPSLDSDGSCEFSLSNGNANLGPLANNRNGTTKTHALLPGSDAIDAADNPTCNDSPVAAEDQTGTKRPQPLGGDCDLGAYETERPEDEEDEVAVTIQVTGAGSGSVVDSELGINIAHSGDGDTEQTVFASPGTQYSLKITANEGSQIEGAEPCEEEPVNFIQEFECNGTIDGDGIFVIRFDFATIPEPDPEPDPEPEPEVVATIDQIFCAAGDFPGFEKLRLLRGVLVAVAQAFDALSNVIQCAIRADTNTGEGPALVQQTGDVGEFGIVEFFLEIGLFDPDTPFSTIRERLADDTTIEVLGRFLNEIFVPFLWEGFSFNPTVESFNKIAANDPYFVIQAQFQAEGPGLVSADLGLDPTELAVVFHAGDPVGDGFNFDSFHAGAVPGIALNPLGDGAVAAAVVDTSSGAVVDGLLTFRADTPGASLLLHQGQETELPGVFISRLVNVAMDGDGVIAVLGRVFGSGISGENDEAVWVCIATLCSIAVQEGMEPAGMPGVQLLFPGSPVVRGGKLLMRTVLTGDGVDNSNNFALLIVDLASGAIDLVARKGDAFAGSTIADFTSKAWSNSVPLVVVRLNSSARALGKIEDGVLIPLIAPGDEFTMPDGSVGTVTGVVDIPETGGEDGRPGAVGGGGYAIVVRFDSVRSAIVACTAACLEGGG